MCPQKHIASGPPILADKRTASQVCVAQNLNTPRIRHACEDALAADHLLFYQDGGRDATAFFGVLYLSIGLNQRDLDLGKLRNSSRTATGQERCGRVPGV